MTVLKNNRKKISTIFWIITAVIVSISIGFDYFKLSLINNFPHYTVATVTEFNSFVRTANNNIEYNFEVGGKLIHGEYRDNRLPADLKGKRILVKYSTVINSWSVPFYSEIIPDSVICSSEGWSEMPTQY